MASARIQDASRILPSGQRSVTRTPVPELRLTEADVREPRALHRVLTQLIQAHKQVSRGARSSTRMRSVVIEGIKVTAGQDLAPIQHGYGTVVRYTVVRWAPATPGDAPAIGETVNDGVRLVLHAGKTGTLDLEIWPV